MIEESQVVVHEGHEPDLLGDLLDADCLTSERLQFVSGVPPALYFLGAIRACIRRALGLVLSAWRRNVASGNAPQPCCSRWSLTCLILRHATGCSGRSCAADESAP